MVVAPPRGERGLKYPLPDGIIKIPQRRSPSWGAWIEIVPLSAASSVAMVAPPRGERGLKSPCRKLRAVPYRSLPLVGSVD